MSDDAPVAAAKKSGGSRGSRGSSGSGRKKKRSSKRSPKKHDGSGSSGKHHRGSSKKRKKERDAGGDAAEDDVPGSAPPAADTPKAEAEAPAAVASESVEEMIGKPPQDTPPLVVGTSDAELAALIAPDVDDTRASEHGPLPPTPQEKRGSTNSDDDEKEELRDIPDLPSDEDSYEKPSIEEALEHAATTRLHRYDGGDPVGYPFKMSHSEFTRFSVGSTLYFRTLIFSAVMSFIMAYLCAYTIIAYVQGDGANRGPMMTTSIIHLGGSGANSVISWLFTSITFLVMLLLVFLHKMQHRVLREQTSGDNVRLHDLSVMVTGVPPEADEAKPVADFFKTFGPVYKVSVLQDVPRFLRMQEQRLELMEELDEAKAAKVLDRKKGYPTMQRNLEHKLSELDERLDARRPNKFSKGVYAAWVTFRNVAVRNKCLRDYGVFGRKAPFGDSRIRVKAAVDPSNYIWSSLHSDADRPVRKLLGVGLYKAILLGFVLSAWFGAGVLMSVPRFFPEMPVLAFEIATAAWALILVGALPNLLYGVSRTGFGIFQTEVQREKFVILFALSASLLLTIVLPFTDFAEFSNLVDSDADGTFLSRFLASIASSRVLVFLVIGDMLANLLRLINRPSLFAMLRMNPGHVHTQSGLNAHYEPRPYRLGEYYTAMLYKLFLCFLLLPAFPLISLTQMISLAISILVDKYILLRQAAAPMPAGGELNTFALTVTGYGLVLYALSVHLFVAWSRGDSVIDLVTTPGLAPAIITNWIAVVVFAGAFSLRDLAAEAWEARLDRNDPYRASALSTVNHYAAGSYSPPEELMFSPGSSLMINFWSDDSQQKAAQGGGGTSLVLFGGGGGGRARSLTPISFQRVPLSKMAPTTQQELNDLLMDL